MNDKKKYIKKALQSIETKKKSLKLKKIKIIKSINALKIEEKELKKEHKKINQSDQLIVSVGFDKRWSSYNCIVKFRTFHFSIYLGNEQKIKKALQQFHKNDINDKKIEDIKTEIKQMVSSVIAPYLIKYKTKDKLSFETIINLYVESGDWDYWRSV